MSRQHKKNQQESAPFPALSPVDRAQNPNELPTDAARAAAGEPSAFDEEPSTVQQRRTGTSKNDRSFESRRSEKPTAGEAGSNEPHSAWFNVSQAAIHGQLLQSLLQFALRSHSELTGKTQKKDSADNKPARPENKDIWHYMKIAFWYPLAVLSNFDFVKAGAKKADSGIAWLCRSGADVTSQGLQKIGEYYQIGETKTGARKDMKSSSAESNSGLRRRVSGADHSDAVQATGLRAVIGWIIYTVWHTIETAADWIQHPHTHWNQQLKGMDWGARFHNIKENSKEAARDSWHFISSTPVMEMPQRLKAAILQPDSKLRQSVNKFWSFGASGVDSAPQSEPQVQAAQ